MAGGECVTNVTALFRLIVINDFLKSIIFLVGKKVSLVIARKEKLEKVANSMICVFSRNPVLTGTAYRVKAILHVPAKIPVLPVTFVKKT